MTAHPHAALMAEYAADMAKDANTPWQYLARNGMGDTAWCDLVGIPNWRVDMTFRRKPAETHHEKTVRYPVPMQEKPPTGKLYWLVEVEAGVMKLTWTNSRAEDAWLSAGLCYEIHREAEAHEAWEARFGEGWK